MQPDVSDVNHLTHHHSLLKAATRESIDVFSNSRRFLAALGIVLGLSDFAAIKSHDELAWHMQTAQKTGGIAAALKTLEASATSADGKAAMLYNMERGELLGLDRNYQASTQAFLLVGIKVKEWEAAAKTNPEKLLFTLGAATLSERLKVYEGQDYEKVWLTTRIALNRVDAGGMDNARVDIKRTHEREARHCRIPLQGNDCCRKRSQKERGKNQRQRDQRRSR